VFGVFADTALVWPEGYWCNGTDVQSILTSRHDWPFQMWTVIVSCHDSVLCAWVCAILNPSLMVDSRDLCLGGENLDWAPLGFICLSCQVTGHPFDGCLGSCTT
jgi:hypothetical protein